MPIDSFDAAAEALVAANTSQDSAPESAPAPEQAQVAAPQGDAGTTSTEDSFSNIDPNLLPAELQSTYRSMQGDYTRAKQQIAEQRKQYESYGSPEEVAQAIQLMNVLQDDPAYVHRQLSEFLQANGMSQAEANQAASDMTAGQEETPNEWEDPDVAARQALQKQVEELQAWRSERERAEREQMQIMAIQRDEFDIREANPAYKQEDIDSIYQLAFAHDGNLKAAERTYAALRDRFASDFVNQKASVNAGVSAPGVTGHSEQARTFTDLNDPELEKAAMAAYLAATGES